MTSPSRALDPEELLAEAGWVRGIVRRLVLDEGLAEDVVQDTWVAALERPARPAGRGGLRAWLAAVAGNLARRRRRRERVRTAIEAAAARAERVEPGGSELERMQLQRLLVEAVLALEEPFRSAVVLRHLDGLSAAEIARRQGCTSELARARVSRGLVQLRARLAREHGPRGEGLLALVPLLGRNPGLVTGGILVGGKLALGIAGGVALALLLWVTTRDGVRGARDETLGPAVAARAPEPAPPGPPLALQPASSDSLPAGASEAGQRAEAEPSRAAEASRSIALQGRVTDTRGQPLAARLSVQAPDPFFLRHGPERVGNETFLVLQRLEEEPLTCGEDGRVSRELPGELARRSLHVEVSCEGYVPCARDLELDQPFTIELEALPALAGRLLDPDGGPVEPPGFVRADVLETTTGVTREVRVELAADGSYRVAGLPLGLLVRVVARARGFAQTELPFDRRLEADRTLQLDVELAPGAIVTGVVVDALTREPVPHAEVWMEAFEADAGSALPTTTAGEDGRFRLEGANEELQSQDGQRIAVFWLLATAEGYTSTPTRAYASTISDTHAYDFELELEPASAVLELRARMADGSPASGARVWAIDSQGNPHGLSTDGEGAARIEGLPAGELVLWLERREKRAVEGTGPLPGGRLAFELERSAGLLVRKPVLLGERHALRAELELAAGETRRAELVLAPPGPAGFTGRVVDAEGRGLAGVTVRAHLNFEWNGLAMAGEADEFLTDAEGRYRLTGQHPGKYEVWVESDDPSLACSLPRHAYVDVAAEEVSRVEDLVVGRCLTLEGRVLPGSCALDELELAARDPRTDATRATTRLSPDGTFRFEPLVEQAYDVVLLREGVELDRTPASPGGARGLFLRAR